VNSGFEFFYETLVFLVIIHDLLSVNGEMFKVIFRGEFDLVLIQYLPAYLWAQALEFTIAFTTNNAGAAFSDDLAVC
jgi:hypothetical protein